MQVKILLYSLFIWVVDCMHFIFSGGGIH